MKGIILLAVLTLLALGAFFLFATGPIIAPVGGENDAPAPTKTDITPETIKNRGVLRVGVKSDVPGFGLVNSDSGRFEGFDIEIARRLAEELLGDPAKVEFIPVTAGTRESLLDNGEIDFVIATYTATPARRLRYNFSTPYYTDSVGLLVKKISHFRGLADMDGKTLGVAQSATGRAAIETAAVEKRVGVHFEEFATYADIKVALDAGRIQAFVGDKSILRGYLDVGTEILPDVFSPQPYAVATSLDHRELTDWVDGLIRQWRDDGTLAGLIKRFNL